MKHPCQEIITADGVREKQERIFPQKKKILKHTFGPLMFDFVFPLVLS